jgi:hypothetical protein
MAGRATKSSLAVVARKFWLLVRTCQVLARYTMPSLPLVDTDIVNTSWRRPFSPYHSYHQSLALSCPAFSCSELEGGPLAGYT